MTKTANRARHALPLLPILLILFIGGIGVPTLTSCSSDDSDGGGGSPGGGSFKIVRIGTQTWMAENLNTNVPGSKCYGEGGEVVVDIEIDVDGNYNYITEPLSPAEIQSNCTKYDRLYDWATAMALDASCNSVSCAGQIGNPHRGICPQGWHIPSGDDWSTLIDYAGGYSEAGGKLKATSGWNENGNGTDEYGFSALPGGYGYSDGYFYDVGDFGIWWSSSEYESGSNGAYYRGMRYNYENASWNSGVKGNLFSVRCVQD